MAENPINPLHNIHKKYRTMNFVNHYIFTPPFNEFNNSVIAAYPLSSNVDLKNGYNAVIGPNITFVTGVNGNCAGFNATSFSYIQIPDNNAFSFTNDITDSPFSVSFKLKLNTANGSSFIISKSRDGFATNAGEWNVYNSNGNLIVLFSNKTTGYLGNTFLTALTTGVWYDIVMTYSGSGTNSGIKLYLNGISKPYTNTNSGTYTSMKNTSSFIEMGVQGGGSYFLNGYLDEMYIFNKELSEDEAVYLRTNFYPFQ